MSKNLIKFLFELGMLRRVKHEGWKVAGICCPESVAEHSLRAAQIGYFLAKMEKYNDPFEICTMLIFHDIGECRIGDIHKIANRYLKSNEKQAVEDQLNPLKEENLKRLWEEAENQKTPAGKIAKDADLLEQAVTAREYMEEGRKFAKDWLINIAKKLNTSSAKKLLKEIAESNPHDWWQGLKKIN